MHGLALIFTLHFGAQDRPAGDRWLSSDKAKHFFLSAFVQSASFSALRATRVSRNGSLIGATLITGSIGLGKELYDRKYGGDPSVKDLAADGAGILAATALLRHTER